MYILFVGVKVEDYAEWKAGFDTEEGKAFRKASAMKSYQLFQIEDKPNNLVLLCEFDNLEDARKFSQSVELREVSQQSGVIKAGDAYFLEEVEKEVV